MLPFLGTCTKLTIYIVASFDLKEIEKGAEAVNGRKLKNREQMMIKELEGRGYVVSKVTS